MLDHDSRNALIFEECQKRALDYHSPQNLFLSRLEKPGSLSQHSSLPGVGPVVPGLLELIALDLAVLPPAKSGSVDHATNRAYWLNFMPQ
jgi:hypothetical protein